MNKMWIEILKPSPNQKKLYDPKRYKRWPIKKR